MKPLSVYIHKKKRKFKYIFQKAEKFDFYSLTFNNFTHKACKYISTSKKKMTMLHVCWNYRKIVPKILSGKEPFEKMRCGFYDNKLRYKEKNLFKKLNHEMNKKKIIFIVVNIENYYYNEANEAYDHHCTSLIFHPRRGMGYDCFYINSHGEAMAGLNYFEYRITQSRKKKYTFKEPIDIACLKNFLKHFKNFPKTPIINYNKTKEHNFYGCNLQSGDDYGICFLIPLIIWYNLIYNYNKTQIFSTKKEEKIVNLKKFLYKKRLIEFVEWCFASFDEEYVNALMSSKKNNYSLRHNSYCVKSCEWQEFYETKKNTHLTLEETIFNKEKDEFIYKKGRYFIKQLTVSFVSFLTQPFIKKAIL